MIFLGNPKSSVVQEFCEKKYPNPYKIPLNFTALQDNSVVWFGITYGEVEDDPLLEYSYDNKVWEKYIPRTDMALSNGQKIYFRGDGAHETLNYRLFAFKGKIAADGNVMSLLDPTCQQDFVPDNGLTYLFCYGMLTEYADDALVTPPLFPAKTVGNAGYDFMFTGQKGLTALPELPATTIDVYSYDSMFNTCTFNSEITKPLYLPATNLPSMCYQSMFGNINGDKAWELYHEVILAIPEHVSESCYCNFMSEANLANVVRISFDGTRQQVIDSVLNSGVNVFGLYPDQTIEIWIYINDGYRVIDVTATCDSDGVITYTYA